MNNLGQPLVSVIIPTFGRSELLERAIESVIAQTYKNIEIIIVDDNNPDTISRRETEHKMNKYLENKNIKYIKLEKNSGGAIARNIGFENSLGEYICFLDDDDEYHEDKIRLQINKFLSSTTNLSVVGCFANIVNNKKEIKWIEKHEYKGDMFKTQLKKNICTTSIAMIKRELFFKSGGFTNMPSSQEHMMFLKIFSNNPNYDYVDEVLVNIYHHEGPRISTNIKKPQGAIMLREYVRTYYNQLDRNEIISIEKSHNINIAKAYLAINDKKNALKYLKDFYKKYKQIDKELLKTYILILVGLDNMDKLRYKFKKIS